MFMCDERKVSAFVKIKRKCLVVKSSLRVREDCVMSNV